MGKQNTTTTRAVVHRMRLLKPQILRGRKENAGKIVGVNRWTRAAWLRNAIAEDAPTLGAPPAKDDAPLTSSRLRSLRKMRRFDEARELCAQHGIVATSWDALIKAVETQESARARM